MVAISLLISILSVSVQLATAFPQRKTYGSASGVVAGKCAGQSCAAADISGSTGNVPTQKVEGASASGWACVGKYNPIAKAAIDKLGNGKGKGIIPKVMEKTMDSVMAGSTAKYSIETDFMAQHIRKRQFGKGYSGKCTPNILIFARGTGEFGAFGETVGPQMRSGVKSGGGGDAQWTSVGVEYSNTADGNYCIGLPGGMVAKRLLESVAGKCPESKIFLSGYSQGAMVVRIAVAYANDQARKQVKGLVTYGDPFNGAKIKGYDGPIKVFCKPTDAVCTGQFKIGTAHFAYSTSADVRNGAKWLVNVAKGTVDKLVNIRAPNISLS